MPWTEEAAKRLGLTIKRLRLSANISQETLAYTSGVTKNQIQLIEAGKSSGRREALGPSNPRMSTLAGIADALDLSTADLLKQANT